MSRITVPEADIDLAEGEIYAGLTLNDDGTPSHHLVLLAGYHEDTTWRAAVDWAKSINGELPTRREQSLLFANAKRHFEHEWCWSGELYASDASYAWCQTFTHGYQGSDHIDTHCLARAVRRLPI